MIPRTLESTLDRLHARVRENVWCRRAVWFHRMLLFVGFLVLYRTGLYGEIAGWTQLFAGLLLLIPRTTTLAAVIWFPLVLNTWVATFAMPQRGAWAVATLMLAVNLVLLAWDYDRLKRILPLDSLEEKEEQKGGQVVQMPLAARPPRR